MGKHTILLVQYTRDKSTRTFDDFETVAGAMDGVCRMFESQLKQLNPDKKNITYDISNLYDYIDSLTDLSCMIYDDRVQGYLPYNKEWIKSRVLAHLKKVASSGSSTA